MRESWRRGEARRKKITHYMLLFCDLQASPAVHSNEATFFEANSPYFIMTMIVVASLLACAVVCGLTYEILRRRKKKKQGTRGRKNVSFYFLF